MSNLRLLRTAVLFEPLQLRKTFSRELPHGGVYLQDFDYEVVYRSGTQVKHVDYLSRHPTRNVKCLTIDITESEWIRAALYYKMMTLTLLEKF